MAMSTGTIANPARPPEASAAAAARPYLERFERLAASRASEPEWLRQRREQAMDRFITLGFPTLRQEGWRHTSLAPILQSNFVFADAAQARPDWRRQLDTVPLANPGCPRAVLLNGHFLEEWS